MASLAHVSLLPYEFLRTGREIIDRATNGTMGHNRPIGKSLHQTVKDIEMQEQYQLHTNPFLCLSKPRVILENSSKYGIHVSWPILQ